MAVTPAHSAKKKPKTFKMSGLPSSDTCQPEQGEASVKNDDSDTPSPPPLSPIKTTPSNKLVIDTSVTSAESDNKSPKKSASSAKKRKMPSPKPAPVKIIRKLKQVYSDGSFLLTPSESMPMKDVKSNLDCFKSEKLFVALHPLLVKLMSHPKNGGIFNAPLDWRADAMNLPDYLKIIEDPMDLYTIKCRLLNGHYNSKRAFISDVRLVFNNAKKYNPVCHPVHKAALELMAEFDKDLNKIKLDAKNETEACQSCVRCRGRMCALCGYKCRTSEPPILQCFGRSCGQRIKSGSVYYVTPDGLRTWCFRCYGSLGLILPNEEFAPDEKVREEEETERKMQERRNREEQKLSDAYSSSSSRRSSPSDSNSPGGSSNNLPETPSSGPVQYKADLIKRTMYEDFEPWIDCKSCGRWMHHVCGLYNKAATELDPNVKVETGPNYSYPRLRQVLIDCLEKEPEKLKADALCFRCPLCCLADTRDVQDWCFVSKSVTRPPKVPRTSLKSSSGRGRGRSAAVPLPDFAKVFRASELPETPTAMFIQFCLRRRLRELIHEQLQSGVGVDREIKDDPGEITVRMVSCSKHTWTPDPHLREVFTDVPEELHYTSKAFMVFQEHDGSDLCILCLYVQEYGEGQGASSKRCYISYLDSVDYFRPRYARKSMYFEILSAYFAWVRLRGFEAGHIWACPPKRGCGYMFWQRPTHQKTPYRGRLVQWYKDMCARSLDAGSCVAVRPFFTETFNFFLSDDSRQVNPLPHTKLHESKTGNEGQSTSPRPEARIAAPSGSNTSWGSSSGTQLTTSTTYNNHYSMPAEDGCYSATPTLSSPAAPNNIRQAPKVSSISTSVGPSAVPMLTTPGITCTAGQPVQLSVQGVSASTTVSLPGLASLTPIVTNLPSSQPSPRPSPVELLPTRKEPMPPAFEGDYWLTKAVSLCQLRKWRVHALTNKPRTTVQDVMTNLLKTLRKHEMARVFLKPVDVEALNIPQYTNIVKKPMDLGTIRYKLEHGMYPLPKDFAEDVRLVFDNACLFNPPGHWVHRAALTMRELFEKEARDKLLAGAHVKLRLRRSEDIDPFSDELTWQEEVVDPTDEPVSIGGIPIAAASPPPLHGPGSPKFEILSRRRSSAASRADRIANNKGSETTSNVKTSKKDSGDADKLKKDKDSKKLTAKKSNSKKGGEKDLTKESGKNGLLKNDERKKETPKKVKLKKEEGKKDKPKTIKPKKVGTKKPTTPKVKSSKSAASSASGLQPATKRRKTTSSRKQQSSSSSEDVPPPLETAASTSSPALTSSIGPAAGAEGISGGAPLSQTAPVGPATGAMTCAPQTVCTSSCCHPMSVSCCNSSSTCCAATGHAHTGSTSTAPTTSYAYPTTYTPAPTSTANTNTGNTTGALSQMGGMSNQSSMTPSQYLSGISALPSGNSLSPFSSTIPQMSSTIAPATDSAASVSSISSSVSPSPQTQHQQQSPAVSQYERQSAASSTLQQQLSMMGGTPVTSNYTDASWPVWPMASAFMPGANPGAATASALALALASASLSDPSLASALSPAFSSLSPASASFILSAFAPTLALSLQNNSGTKLFSGLAALMNSTNNSSNNAAANMTAVAAVAAAMGALTSAMTGSGSANTQTSTGYDVSSPFGTVGASTLSPYSGYGTSPYGTSPAHSHVDQTATTFVGVAGTSAAAMSSTATGTHTTSATMPSAAHAASSGLAPASSSNTVSGSNTAPVMVGTAPNAAHSVPLSATATTSTSVQPVSAVSSLYPSSNTAATPCSSSSMTLGSSGTPLPSVSAPVQTPALASNSNSAMRSSSALPRQSETVAVHGAEGLQSTATVLSASVTGAAADVARVKLEEVPTLPTASAGSAGAGVGSTIKDNTFTMDAIRPTATSSVSGEQLQLTPATPSTPSGNSWRRMHVPQVPRLLASDMKRSSDEFFVVYLSEDIFKQVARAKDEAFPELAKPKGNGKRKNAKAKPIRKQPPKDIKNMCPLTRPLARNGNNTPNHKQVSFCACFVHQPSV